MLVTWQDIVERLHLLAVIIFVLVEDMESTGSWAPSAAILWESSRILFFEVCPRCSSGIACCFAQCSLLAPTACWRILSSQSEKAFLGQCFQVHGRCCGVGDAATRLLVCSS